MNKITKLSAVCAASLVLAGSARSAQYTDATGDGTLLAGFPHLDISSLNVTNDGTNISFQIFLVGDPIAVSWGEYQVGINLIPGAGATNGTVPNGRPITMSVGGMDYWVRSWNGGAETYHWEAGGQFWFGDNFTWAPPSDIQIPTRTTNSVTLTTTLASLGLVTGDQFYFDVTTSGGTPTDSAIDALANPDPTAASGDWVSPYDSSNRVYQYTVTGPAPVLTNAFGAAYSDTLNDLLAATVAETHLNIAAVSVTNDSTHITFTIFVEGDPVTVSWGQYNIGIDNQPAAGATLGTVPPARPITMSNDGMDYWIRSWDAGAESYHWDSTGQFWALDQATYNPPSDLQLPTRNANSVTLTTTLASLGLSPGSTFKFDVYTAGGNDGDSAVDALANPIRTFASGDWVTPYDSGTKVYQYTVSGGAALAPTLSNAQKEGSNFTVNVPTQTGFSYVLEFADSLPAATWTAVQTNAGIGSTITMTNSGAIGSNGFYRVRVQ
jgi:hypothetical protein